MARIDTVIFPVVLHLLLVLEFILSYVGREINDNCLAD